MSEDLIRRSDAIKATLTSDVDDVRLEDVIAVTDAVADAIEAIPTIEPKRGEWVPFEYGDERWHKCTACGVADRYIEYVERPNGTIGKLVAIRNFCPNYGARMRPKLQGKHFDSIIIDECAMKGADDEY